MLVYIVCRAYDYEGFDEPEAVFAERARAEAYVASQLIPSSGCSIEIFELVVN